LVSDGLNRTHRWGRNAGNYVGYEVVAKQALMSRRARPPWNGLRRSGADETDRFEETT